MFVFATTCDTPGCLGAFIAAPGESAEEGARAAGWEVAGTPAAAHTECPGCAAGRGPVMERGECPVCMGAQVDLPHGAQCHTCRTVVPHPDDVGW